MVNSIGLKDIKASDVISDVDDAGNTGAFNLEPTQGETKASPAHIFFADDVKAQELATELAADLGFGEDDEMIADITTLVKLHAKNVNEKVTIEEFVTNIIETLQQIAGDDGTIEDNDTSLDKSKVVPNATEEEMLRQFLKNEFEDIAGGEDKILDAEDAEKIAKLLGVDKKEAEDYINNNKGKVDDVVNDIVNDVFGK